MRRPARGNQSHQGTDSDVGRRDRADCCWMKIAVLQSANSFQVCGCAQVQRRRPKSLEYLRQRTSYTAGTKRKLKSAATGGNRRVRPGSHRSSKADAPSGRRRRQCVTVDGVLPPPARVESDIGGTDSLGEAPKISQTEIPRASFP
jgi:hypothetical protein